MANQDRVNFVWAESALTTIPPIPVSEVAYRDTTQTPEQMEVGQQYDTIYNSARHNQLLFLLTSVAKTLCENGIMPFLAGQEYSQYARCIFTDGKLYTASRAILANEQPYPTPGDDSGVWIAEETNENLVPNSRRVIAGTGLTGGGPLSSDVTLSAKLDRKTTQAAADGAITVKDVAIGGDLGDLARERGQLGAAQELGNNVDYNTVTKAGFYLINAAGGVNGPIVGSAAFLQVFYSKKDAFTKNLYQIAYAYSPVRERMFLRQYRLDSNDWSSWSEIVSSSRIGDGLTVNNGIISVPEYDGATASTAGTSGLVPPAAAGQQESFLTGGGKYKPAVQQGGGKGQGNNKIYIGYSESGLKAQADTLDLGNVVTTSAGCTKAPSAALADNATNARNLVVTDDGKGAKFNWSGRYTGQPEWVWGGNAAEFGNMYTWNPANFSVNFANSAATANKATGLTYTFTKNSSLVLPPGGTWFVLNWWDGEGGTANGNWSGGQIVAGGSSVGVSNGAFALRVA